MTRERKKEEKQKCVFFYLFVSML